MADGSNHRSPSDIEAEIEHERADLNSTLEALQNQFSPDRLVGSLADHLKTSGGDIGAQVGRAVRDNPAAAVLTGLGVAWLVMGGMRKSDHGDRPQDQETPSAPASAGAPPETNAFEERVAEAEAAQRAEATGLSTESDRAPLPARAGSAAGRARHGYDVASRKVRTTLADLQDRLHDGTEGLSEAARRRVIAARQAAIEAQSRVEHAGRRAKAEAQRAYTEQPLVAGALAAMIGAAIGAALPRTQVEDRHLGAESDRLFDEAERIYQNEKARARQMATAALREGRDIARETLDGSADQLPTGEEVANAAESRVRTTGARIASAAMEAREDV